MNYTDLVLRKYYFKTLSGKFWEIKIVLLLFIFLVKKKISVILNVN
jgi:hypothetical protein